jgi:hypothetical protein
METLKLLVRVIILVFTTLMLSSCSNGWSVAGLDMDSEDSMYTFVEVLDQDSTSHFYSDHVRFDKDMWCFTHSRWEIVRKK